MNKFLTLIFMIFFNISYLNAEIVNQIEINGNKRVSVETVKVYGDIKPTGSNFTKADLDKKLKNLYNTNFFETINVQIKNKKLIINLKEYPVVNELIILGEPSNKFKDQIIKIISTKAKGSFIENN